MFASSPNFFIPLIRVTPPFLNRTLETCQLLCLKHLQAPLSFFFMDLYPPIGGYSIVCRPQKLILLYLYFFRFVRGLYIRNRFLANRLFVL